VTAGSKLQRVAPELPVTDMDRAISWYEAALGFRTAMTMPDGDYAVVERDSVALHLFLGTDASPGACHIFTGDAEGLLNEFATRGTQILQPLEQKPWGNRDFRLLDPFGNELKFTEPRVQAA